MPLVVAGEVVAVSNAERPDTLPQIATVAVREQFRGPAVTTIELNSGSTSCARPLALGESYLIYAFPTSDGRWMMPACGRSGHSFTPEDLTYARLPIAQKGPSRILGMVRGPVLKQGSTSATEPVKGARVTASDGRRRYATVTADDGRYQLNAPSGVALTVRFEDPSGRMSFGGERTVTIAGPHACAMANGYGQSIYPRSSLAPAR
jgi:hypothetical protein